MVPLSTSRLHTAGSDHNVHPSTEDINILLKVPAKTSLFHEQIEFFGVLDLVAGMQCRITFYVESLYRMSLQFIYN